METPSETFLEIAAVIAPGYSNPKSSRRTSRSEDCETRLTESVRSMQDQGVLGGLFEVGACQPSLSMRSLDGFFVKE